MKLWNLPRHHLSAHKVKKTLLTSKRQDVQKYLTNVFKKKSGRVLHQLMDASERVHIDVVEWLENRVKSRGIHHMLKDSWILSNQFFMGDQRARLPVEWQLSALQQLAT